MATFKLSVPSKGLISPDKWGSRAQIRQMIMDIWRNYALFIWNASLNSNIPKSIIISFIAVESGGNPNAGGAGHITQGLMQWNRSYAKKQLEEEYQQGRMSSGEMAVLKKYGIMKADNSFREVTNADQIHPEINITIGSIILGQLLDQPWASDNNGLHLDRVIAVYNAGSYGDTGKKARQLTTPKLDRPDTLAANVNSVTSAYIKKILGENGALDIVTSDLKTTIP